MKYLFIDGRNLVYRAIYARRSSGDSTSTVIVCLKLLRSLVHRLSSNNIFMFWDDCGSGSWRKNLLNEYKVRDVDDSVRKDLIESQDVLIKLIKHIGIKQFIKKDTEADDLIYAACRILTSDEIIICSSDGDYKQIIYRMQNVKLYDPLRHMFTAVPEYDPVIEKSFRGDKSDNIDGYYGIGPVNAKKLSMSISDRNKYLDKSGRTKYIRNCLLIDLSLNPNLLKNLLYIERVLSEDNKYDKAEIFRVAKDHKLSQIISDYGSLILPLKSEK